MHLATFIASRLNRPIDLDGEFGPQCTDLVNVYAIQVLGMAPWAGDAVAFQQVGRPGLRWEANGPLNAPSAGDVVCWRANVPSIGIGPEGHVAIALTADSMELVTLDQNWAGHRYVAVELHSYAGVAGWWHRL